MHQQVAVALCCLLSAWGALAGEPPLGSVGICRADPPAPAGVDAAHAPAATAHCPDPLEYTRGNGSPHPAPIPLVKPSIMPEWDLDALRDYACAYACAPAGAKAYLLAWSITEDRRPLRNHHAAFVVEQAKKWTVIVMYRRAANLWWNISVPHHSKSSAVRAFDHRPSAAEVNSLLDENRWQFADDRDWRVLAGNLIGEAWLLAIGAPPTRSFPGR